MNRFRVLGFGVPASLTSLGQTAGLVASSSLAVFCLLRVLTWSLDVVPLHTIPFIYPTKPKGPYFRTLL